MVKFPLPADTFPKLALAPKDVASLEAVSAQLVKNTLKLYHEHAVESRGIVDETRWKRVRQKDDIRVFKERSSVKKSSPQPPAAPQAEEKVAPQLMGVGTMLGDLDDVMFGVLNHTTEAMRIKSSYNDDGFLDGSVLATLIEPSRNDPLRSLTLRWCVKRNPLLMTGIVRMRDVVYLESTGIAFTDAGERIGYQLLHSVELPEVRALMEYELVRANVSFCYVYRQKTPASVEVFMRGMLNPLGGVHPSLCVISTAESLVSVSTNIHVAQMKKLTWLLRSAKARTFQAEMSTSQSSQSRGGPKRPTSACQVCLQSRTSAFGSRKSCTTCLESICSKCCVVKKLSYVSASKRHSQDGDISQIKLTFCTRCALRAFETNALTVAIDEIDDAHDPLDLMRLRSTTSSSNSSFHTTASSSSRYM